MQEWNLGVQSRVEHMTEEILFRNLEPIRRPPRMNAAKTDDLGSTPLAEKTKFEQL